MRQFRHNRNTAKKRWFFSLVIVLSLGFGLFGRTNVQPAAAEDTRLVTVHVDGLTRTVATNEPTVEMVLEKLDIDVSSQDKAEPSLETEVKGTDFTINLYRARPITVVDGANNYTVMTAERSPKEIAEEAGFTTNSEDQFNFQRSDDPFAGAPGTQMVIQRSKSILLDLYGVVKPVNTHQTSVSGFLEDRDIKLDPSDELSLPPQSRITEGMTISITRVGRAVETVEEPALFEEEQIKDAQQPTSYKKIQTPGKNGKKLVTYETVTKNGGAPVRTAIKEVITEQPVKQVVIVGAQGFSGSLGEWLRVLRTCESGGNYQINSGNGYYGAYQFSAETWRRITPKAGRPELASILPHQASPADQDYMIIQNTKLSSGGLASQNPGCYKKYGLSAFPPS